MVWYRQQATMVIESVDCVLGFSRIKDQQHHTGLITWVYKILVIVDNGGVSASIVQDYDSRR